MGIWDFIRPDQQQLMTVVLLQYLSIKKEMFWVHLKISHGPMWLLSP